MSLLLHAGNGSNTNISSYGTTQIGDSSSRVGQLRGQIDEVKGMVVESIDKLHQRGENLERTSMTP